MKKQNYDPRHIVVFTNVNDEKALKVLRKIFRWNLEEVFLHKYYCRLPHFGNTILSNDLAIKHKKCLMVSDLIAEEDKRYAEKKEAKLARQKKLV